MRKAIIINFISKYLVALVQLLINFVLARLVSPQEFGIVAIITVFSSFFSVFSDMGIGASIIQFKKLGQDAYNHIYSFTFYAGIILMGVFVAVGYILSFVYGNNVYVSLAWILAVSIFFNTLNIVPSSILLKEHRFTEIGIRTVCIIFLSGTITIFLAYLGFKYYAVVIFSVLQAMLSYFWNRLRVPLKISFIFKWEPVKNISSFSSYQLLFNVVNYFVSNTDTLLAGKYFGEREAGLYYKSYQLMTYPISMFSGAITPALHPVLSDYQDDKDVIYGYLLKMFRVLLYFSIFVSSVCFFAPKELIYILYGNNWDAAVTSFQMLSLSIVTKMCNSITGSFYQSLGRTDILFKVGLVNAILVICFTIAGMIGGTIESLAFFTAIGYVACFWVAFYFLVHKAFGKSYMSFLRMTAKPYVIYLFLLFIVRVCPIQVENMVIGLVVKVLIVGAAYSMLMLIMGEFQNFKDAYKILLKKK